MFDGGEVWVVIFVGWVCDGLFCCVIGVVLFCVGLCEDCEVWMVVGEGFGWCFCFFGLFGISEFEGVGCVVVFNVSCELGCDGVWGVVFFGVVVFVGVLCGIYDCCYFLFCKCFFFWVKLFFLDLDLCLFEFDLVLGVFRGFYFLKIWIIFLF